MEGFAGRYRIKATEEYAEYLARAYKQETFAKPKNVVRLTKSLPVPEMEQLRCYRT